MPSGDTLQPTVSAPPSVSSPPSIDREIETFAPSSGAPSSEPTDDIRGGSVLPTTVVSTAPSSNGTTGPPTDVTLEEFLTQELTTGGEINVEGSPHNLAYRALENSNPELDPNLVGDQETILLRYSLNVLFFFTNGGMWTNRDGWTTSSDPCGWFGIECVEIELQGIQLDTNLLLSREGLPSELRALTDLVSFDLSTNFIEGTLPTALASLERLEVLNFADNFFFFDAFPNEWEVLTNLRELQLQVNTFSGTLSSRLGSLTLLTLLNYSDNNRFDGGLGGDLPTEMALMTNLESLQLGENDFKSFPAEFAALTNLRQLDIHFNDFRGQSVPDIFANMPNLQVVDVSDNFFTGTLPESLITLGALRVLLMNLNELTGSVPTTIDLPSAEIVNLGVNFLNRTLPSELERLVSLREFVFFDNFVTGEIPLELLSLQTLELLNLQLNEFTGPLPSTYNLPVLRNFNIAQNFFDGEFPPNFFGLTLLTSLNVADNILESFIPSELALLTDLNRLLLTGNDMTGVIPSELGLLEQLTELRIGLNELRGGIPTELAQLTSLSVFTADGNPMATPIPTIFESMPNLRTLFLNSTLLNSTLPTSLFSIVSLRELYLQENDLTGTLPTEVGNLDSLGKSTLICVNSPYVDFARHDTYPRFSYRFAICSTLESNR